MGVEESFTNASVKGFKVKRHIITKSKNGTLHMHMQREGTKEITITFKLELAA